jgi:hypothetical protein
MRLITTLIILTAISLPALAAETTPQPLTRADCEKAGMQWNDNANVCGAKQAVAKPMKAEKPKKK